MLTQAEPRAGSQDVGEEQAIPSADYVARLREEIEEQREELTSDAIPRSEFYVFFSYDLVNSTLFKSLNQAEWPLVTQKFYEFVDDALRKHVSDAGDIRLWKYVGDELLLYRRIHCLADLRNCLPAAHEALLRTSQRLWELFPDTRTVLAVKATVWCAKVVEPPSADMQAARQDAGARDGVAEQPVYPNILVRATDESGRGQRDFLGPDIDIGFRIAKHALRQRLVVSANLAYLLYRDRAADDRGEKHLRIVSFEQLKGVWDNRHYPILWYEPDWNTVPASFAYDEHFHHDVVRHLRSGQVPEHLSAIVKILDDVGRTPRAEALWDFVRDLQPTDEDEITEAPGATITGAKEVHCAAVCFRVTDGRVLIARRPKTKNVQPGAWEFGCGQLEPFESFADCLRRAYAEDFGVDIEVADAPEPISTYVVDRGPRAHRVPGIVFLAEVHQPEGATNLKHEEIRWVEPGNPGLAPGDATVPNLRETLQLAAEIRSRPGRAAPVTASGRSGRPAARA